MIRRYLVAAILSTLGVAVVAAAYLGAYDVAGDSPHWGITAQVMAYVRDRSIAARAAGIAVPNLADRNIIATGAQHYAEMCTGCHLAPGMSGSELRQGLYPVPPNLSHGSRRSPAQEFWIIKHGIKMTAMPAWGTTHDDEAIWAIVAFVRQLPNLDAKSYAALTGDFPAADHDHDDAHHHDPGDHGDAPEHNRLHGTVDRDSPEAGHATIGASETAAHAPMNPDGEKRPH